MRFEVAKREVELGWNHVWFVIGIMFAIVAAFLVLAGVITALISSSSGTPLWDSYLQAMAFITTILSILTPPLAAFAYIFAMPYFKLKKDATSCRSVVSAQFMLLTAATFVLVVIVWSTGPLMPLAWWPFEIIGMVATSASGAISLYLWMLIFLKNDVDGVKKSALTALMAAVSISAVSIIAPYTMVEVFGLGTIPTIGLGTLMDILRNLWFALPLMLFMPKKLDDATYLFAGLYVCGILSIAISGSFLGSESISLMLSIIDAIATIGIVYIAGTYGRRT